MLAEGRAAFRAAPWISIGPGIMLSLTVWSVNDLADRLIQRPA
jgi:ABC-type dipeptide/oligopeptide/nickel transport system permease subunit